MMVQLLRQLIATPSQSRHEDASAQLLFNYLRNHGAEPRRHLHNVWCLSEGYCATRPTLMLNSHHDTVRPSESYTRNPYSPDVEGDRLYGLGSNDAGASLVALVDTFLQLRTAKLPFNLLLALTAEEEVGGEGGMRAFLPMLKAKGVNVAAAIVGEPTGMQPAVGERGLVVLDCVTPGVTGHAARGEGVNAIYRAMADIDAVRSYQFPHESAVLGPASVNVTQIQAGWAHNAIPDECRWVVDVRTTDAYTNAATVELLRGCVAYSTLTPRSTRVEPSVIDASHPLVKACVKLGRQPFVSPTTSDMSLMHGLPSLKIGPGQSARSHSADEYVLLSEIEEGAAVYKEIISNI